MVVGGHVKNKFIWSQKQLLLQDRDLSLRIPFAILIKYADDDDYIASSHELTPPPPP